MYLKSETHIACANDCPHLTAKFALPQVLRTRGYKIVHRKTTSSENVLSNGPAPKGLKVKVTASRNILAVKTL